MSHIPQPANTIRFGADGAPNACNACHADQSPEWALAQMSAWWPTP
jgi:hypothetical protein